MEDGENNDESESTSSDSDNLESAIKRRRTGKHVTPKEWRLVTPKGCKIEIHKPSKSVQAWPPTGPSRSFAWGKGHGKETMSEEDACAQAIQWLCTHHGGRTLF
jgi:hypothetical protein